MRRYFLEPKLNNKPRCFLLARCAIRTCSQFRCKSCRQEGLGLNDVPVVAPFNGGFIHNECRNADYTARTAELCFRSSLSNYLTPWSRSLPENLLIDSPLVKKFSAFYTRAPASSVFWGRWIQSMPSHRSSFGASHLRHVGLPSGLLLSDFPTSTLN